MAPWHLGSAHPVEQLLTILLALGPFMLLGVVTVLQRRRDARAEEAEVARDTAHRQEPER